MPILSRGNSLKSGSLGAMFPAIEFQDTKESDHAACVVHLAPVKGCAFISPPPARWPCVAMGDKEQSHSEAPLSHGRRNVKWQAGNRGLH